MLILSACQHRPEITPSADSQAGWLNDWERFEPRATSVSAQWRYTAKVGITTPQLREQANMVWQYQDQSNNVRLFGPLGAGAVVIDFDQYGVQLSDNKGGVHRGDSAEDLLSKITGWPIPVQSLRHWLFVRPDPNLLFRYQLDEIGNVASIEQSGWRIIYADYRDYGGPQQLPRKLTASRTVGLHSGDTVTVKLITKEWQF